MIVDISILDICLYHVSDINPHDPDSIMSLPLSTIPGNILLDICGASSILVVWENRIDIKGSEQMSNSELTLYDLVRDAKEVFVEEIAKAGFTTADECSDLLHEITDSHVPVYHSDLLDLAAKHNHLGTDIPEFGPAFDGSPTAVNIIAANVYEHLSNELHKKLNAIEDANDLQTKLLLSGRVIGLKDRWH